MDINNEHYKENLNKVEIERDTAAAVENEIASNMKNQNDTDAAMNSSHGEHEIDHMGLLNITAQNSGSRLTKTAI